MYKKSIILGSLALFVALIAPQDLFAVETGKTIHNSRMRAGNGTVFGTIAIIPQGTTVKILEERGGWYKVEALQKEGWTAAWLIKKEKIEKNIPTLKQEVLGTKSKEGRLIHNSRVRKGPGTQNAVVTTLSKGTIVKILEEKNDWYAVQGPAGEQGWTATWLVEKGESFTIKLPPSDKTKDIPNLKNVSATTPAGVNEEELNEHWLEKVNTLRAKRNLRQLVLDDRWKKTAAEYAEYWARTNATNHGRPQGQSMHDWIDNKNLPFMVRYTEGAWKVNYFTENISWGIVEPNTESVKAFLDRTMDWFLAEASYNGPHYRTTYHPDWNSVGVGFHFEPWGNGKYKARAVYHYGSLVQ